MRDLLSPWDTQWGILEHQYYQIYSSKGLKPRKASQHEVGTDKIPILGELSYMTLCQWTSSPARKDGQKTFLMLEIGGPLNVYLNPFLAHL
uniref:Uncharacterized protein n=1 Tax=Pyxicephalus adspersus TaxID=30357 RepID=A0AAV3ABX3_PYXAD|nr:TPA: hypothetical protein GDO54_011787 [Pyxicephalus adspersus]